MRWETEILGWVESLPFEWFAVRSSSTTEDSMDFSMAGQYDTFLNTPARSVPDNVKKCWAGMFNDAVIAYSKKNNLPVSHRMGVVLQRQMDPVYAGVLFTMDPLTKSTDHLIVEWVDGLGDKLVSGEVNPERLYIQRLLPQVHSDENMEEYLAASLQQLADLALKAETQYHHPVDIEWCVDDSGVYVLQVRPVTGLTGDDINVWTNVNMAENFPRALTPFTWSIVDTFYTYYIKNILRMFGWKDDDLLRNRAVVEKPDRHPGRTGLLQPQQLVRSPSLFAHRRLHAQIPG